MSDDFVTRLSGLLFLASVVVQYRHMASHLLGFDIGGTKCAVVFGKSHGDEIEILDRLPFATEASRGPEFTLLRLEEGARAILERQGLALHDAAGLGISCGSPLDSRRGLILSPPNLPGWDEVPIVARFEERLGIPTRLQNDANACALAEWRWGAGRGCRHMIFLTFGTGFGAGLILDGRLYVGACDMAGEIGHVRMAADGPVGYGKAGSMEGFCSGGGIARAAQALVQAYRRQQQPVAFAPDDLPLEAITARLVAEAAQAGDSVALEIYATVAAYLGRGLAILIDLFNPERIVIGSIFTRQRDLLWPIAEQVIREEALAINAHCCEVVPALLGEAIGDYACLSVAAEAARSSHEGDER